MKGNLLEEPKFYIYKIIFDNGATYIGSHIERKSDDGYICSSKYYERHPELKIISREILFYLPSLEQMNFMETVCIMDDKCYSSFNVNGNYGNYAYNFHTKLDCPWNKGLKMSKEYSQKQSERNSEPIICIETGEILPRVNSINHGTEIVTGKRKTYKGRHYRRYNINETPEMTKLFNKQHLMELYHEDYFYYIEEYNIAFENIGMIAGIFGINIEMIKENFGKDYRGITVYPVFINYLLDYNIPIIWKLKLPNWCSKKVRCIETGEVFDTVKEASKKYNTYHISDAINGRREMAGGFHWEVA